MLRSSRQPERLGEPTDEFRKFAEDTLAEGRKHDGVEATIQLLDPAKGKTLVINIFRDRAAMDAFQKYSNAGRSPKSKQ